MAGDKRKRSVKEVAPENTRTIEPSGFMATSQVATRDEEGCQRRRREVVASSMRQDSEGGATTDADVSVAIRQLPSYLQPVVTLSATMDPPHEESKMREKRGKDTLEQAASVMITVSITSPLDKFFFKVL